MSNNPSAFATQFSHSDHKSFPARTTHASIDEFDAASRRMSVDINAALYFQRRIPCICRTPPRRGGCDPCSIGGSLPRRCLIEDGAASLRHGKPQQAASDGEDYCKYSIRAPTSAVEDDLGPDGRPHQDPTETDYDGVRSVHAMVAAEPCRCRDRVRQNCVHATQDRADCKHTQYGRAARSECLVRAHGALTPLGGTEMGRRRPTPRVSSTRRQA